MMFFLKNKDIEDNELESALKACKYADKEGYEDAQTHLQRLGYAIVSSSKFIADCIRDMQESHINDTTLIEKVKGQLNTVLSEFERSYEDTKNNVQQKHRQTTNFNITLFGRTKAGKSTLMEILTHGDGSHMGKGGQRTTRDVRTYNWKGMSVTDVPGIDAYGEGGRDDEQIAEAAASYADLIIFLITAGQPEGSEADWLVRLKKMDKPILCICNFKRSIDDEMRLRRFLKHPERIAQQMNIKELVEQFNKFINKNLPNEHVDFLVTHLLAKFCSEQPEYAAHAKQLSRISRFDTVEKAIIQTVYSNGIIYRKKSYLSIIDAPLYEQMNELFRFSADTYSQFRVVQDKMSGFDDWCDKFNNDEKSRLLDVVRFEFDKIRNSIPGFVEDHLESDHLTALWNDNCKKFNVQANIEKAVEQTNDRLTAKIRETFSELQTEMKLNLDLENATFLGDFRFANWKKRFEWAGAIGGAGLGLAALFFGGPLGWAAIGVSLLFGLFSWLSDSKEEKLRERRTVLTEKLNKYVNKEEQKTSHKIETLFSIEGIKKGAVIKAEHQAKHYLSLVKGSLLSLTNSERSLALEYCKNHVEISKRMACNILESMGVSEETLSRIRLVARVPSRKIVLVVDGDERLKFDRSLFQSRLGNTEDIWTINYNVGASVEKDVYALFRYFRLNKPLVKSVNKGEHTVVYVWNNHFNQQQIDNMNIIQQIMNVHIIIK